MAKKIPIINVPADPRGPYFPAICGRSGCQKQARWYPVVKVWAEDMEKTAKPLECIILLAMCDDHKDEVTLEDLPEVPQLVHQACAEARLRQPDWSTAVIEVRKILFN